MMIKKLRCKEHVRAHIHIHLNEINVFHESTYPEVNENCFVIVVKHDIIGFDITVDKAYDLVAVIKCFDHIDKVGANFVSSNTSSVYLLSFFE